MKNSSIEWCDHTFNPWIGCTKVSPGCANCYAEKIAARFQKAPWGKGQPRKRTSEKYWENPLSWNRRCKRLCIRERVFCASMADVFDEEVCIEDFKDLLELIFKTQNLDWQLLTKRPENINKHLLDAFQSCFGGDTTDGHEYWDPFMEWLGSWSTFGNPPQNVWIGVSVENQEQADKRIPILLETPAAVRFLSCEPLLGPVSLSPQALGAGGRFGRNYQMPQIDWVIAGGESGHGARPMHPDWALSLRDQCKAARVPFLFKQWGEYYGESVNGTEVATDTLAPNEMVAWGDGNTYHIKYTRLGKTKSGRLLDGVEYNEFPKRST